MIGDQENINRYKNIFFSNKSFEKYINSLPRYHRIPRSKYEKHIRDFLIRNRSASLADIVRGCEEHGLQLKAHYPSPMFYKSLKNLMADGHVTKRDKVYFWNYNE